LEEFLGTARGLSPAAVARIAAQWSDEADQWGRRPLGDYVYVWADGVYLKVRIGGRKVCLLVLLGVRRVVGGPPAGLQTPGDARPPSSPSGTGARVLEGARGGVPRHRRTALLVPQVRQRARRAPKTQHPSAVKALREIHQSATRADATKAAAAFTRLYGAKWPKAAAKITDDLDELLSFCDYLAEHWTHLRTTNPIESVFSAVNARTRVTKGAGSPAAAVAMAFILMQAAAGGWRRLTAPHMAAEVWAGTEFNDGEPTPTDTSDPTPTT
jgi:transposase-like protein